MLKIYDNLRSLGEALDQLETDQLPFAVSVAMNASTFAARNHIVRTVWPRSVSLRNKRFAGAAIRVTKKATKHDLVTAVFDTLDRDAFRRQAEGERRKPVSGRSLAIPVGVKRLTGGAVPKAKRPRALLDKSKFFINKKHTAIMERVDRTKVRIVYSLTPVAKVAPRFPAESEAMKAFDHTFPFEFDRAMTNAVNTAVRRTYRGVYKR